MATPKTPPRIKAAANCRACPDLRKDAELPGLDVQSSSQEAEAVFGERRQRLAADLDDDVNHSARMNAALSQAMPRNPRSKA